MTSFDRIAPLSPAYDVTTFDCGSDAQTDWLRRHALRAQQADTARVYVTCHSGTPRVAGFYAIAAGSVRAEQAPARLTTGIGRYPVPVVVLARLGVDRDAQGRGLGSSLVRDAFIQTAAVAERLGVRALLIHAETPRAAEFYRGLDTAFEPMPGEPLHLVLLMKDLRKAIGLAGTQRSLSGG